jgi:hypothetical protein
MLRRTFVLALVLVASDAAAQRSARQVRTIETNGAVAATVKEGARCRAYAPADWRTVGGSPAGDAFDLTSGDRRMYAGWGIRGINRAMEMTHGALFGDPETSSLAVSGAVLQTIGSAGTPRYVGVAERLGAGFIARTFASASHKGIVVYRVYPAPAGYPPGSYIISLRIAVADRQKWDADGQRIAAGVAASINCTTMLTRSRGPDTDLPRPGDPPGMRRRGGETDDLADYNAQLGTQWVRSESTGERYLVDHASAWNENGPDGPGYYRKSGNTYEKLTPGFGN